MTCEFAKPSMDGRSPCCRKTKALREIITIKELGEIYTEASLMREICYNPNGESREQCHVYPKLVAQGRSSRYSK
jgi:hypothetical protein